MSVMECLRARAVLQDCADQLSVIGNIIRPRAETQKSGSIESDFRVESLKSQKHFQVQASLHALETLNKVQKDRQFVSDVIHVLMAELQEKNTFNSLFFAIDEERKRKARLLETIKREEEGRLRIKALQKELLDIRKQKLEECERLEELVALLKEQVQELRVRTSREGTFVRSCADQLVFQGLQHSKHKENQLEEDVKVRVRLWISDDCTLWVWMLQRRIEEELDVHVEMESFLQHQNATNCYAKQSVISSDEAVRSLKETLKSWMRRFEKDLEEKDQEITALQNKRNSSQMRMQELSRKCREMEEVVIEDRMEKERLRAQLEKDEKERKAATKLQAWWRGMIVRKGLGSPKKPPKKKDGKKGKKKRK
ncbi:hypothetical protein DNTS_020284 [Danionella cerebrum]|uniref:Dynein regulatory complex protein 9 n=1 Tax=Danionella cerebrum TaxID=2873325 RepID=A0A553Q0F7_9TELE|nr:hypothetical protein DNTS_020284 [Danionella translucida]